MAEKLTPHEILQIRRKLYKKIKTIQQIANEHGVSKTTIIRVKQRKRGGDIKGA